MNLKNSKGPQQIEDTVECVAALAQILKENDLGRIKVSTVDDIEIVIEAKQFAPPVGAIPPMGAMPPVQGAMPPMGAMPPAAPAEKQPADVPETGNYVTSPIIGTFYSSPSPEKPSFVKVGDTVNAGDVVCIIESMKLMNEINCEFSGRVADIYVNNGDSVEYGQKLMRIE